MSEPDGWHALVRRLSACELENVALAARVKSLEQRAERHAAQLAAQSEQIDRLDRALLSLGGDVRAAEKDIKALMGEYSRP